MRISTLLQTKTERLAVRAGRERIWPIRGKHTEENQSKEIMHEILKDTVPKLVRVGFLQQAAGGDLPLKDIRAAAPVLKVKLEEIKTHPTIEGIGTLRQG